MPKAACAECGEQNREGRRFCGRCGSPLTRLHPCPACGEANEPGERYCGGCGQLLSAQGDAGARADDVEERERKHLTVLFADIQGSMDLQRDLDPEAWAAIMGRVVGILAEGVRRFGGTVDKFTGDGVMALFGAPLSQEDHALRACRAALHLTRTISAFAAEIRAEREVDLGVRIGLNSGEAVVGRVGDDRTLDPTALGHAVGLAQRMESLAAPGSVYLTAATARLAEARFRLTALGPTAVKGVRAPVEVFRLEGPADAPSVSATLGSAPIVGREAELAVLTDALAGAVSGRAQVVGVVGEAGVGKSRLCEEFLRVVAERGVTARRTAGVSHGREIPLLPVIAFLREIYGIAESDEPAVARGKIRGLALALDPAAEADLPLLLDLLEVPDPARPAPPLAPEARLRRVFDAIRRQIKGRSAQAPLVVLLEDLHWFDPQSEAFFERLIESYPGTRTLVVANFRPEFSARWMRHSYYRQVPLAALDDAAVSDLVRGLAGDDASLTPLAAFVRDRTGGNPFFVEELLRALVEDGTLTGPRGALRLARPLGEVRVPPSVHAVLAARIDRLPPEHKALLQTASVIGRTFGQAVLATVSGVDPATFDDALAGLCGAELLQAADDGDGAELRFWHPLTQEVAYGSLVAQRKAALHTAVAGAYELADPARHDELSATLAFHWERAGRPVEAARWNLRAGESAARRDLGEAHRRWQATLDLLASGPSSPEALALGVKVRTRLMQFGARTGIALEESERLYVEARALAERLGDTRLLGTMMFMSGTPMFTAGAYVAARARWWGEPVELSERSGDLGLITLAGIGYGWLGPYMGPLDECLARVERAISACAGDVEAFIDLRGFSPLVRLYEFRAALLARAGRLTEARTDLDRCLALVRTRAEPDTLAWALASVPHLAWFVGDGQDAVPAAEEAVAVSEDTGNFASRARALEGLAAAYLALGCPAEAVGAAERALAAVRAHPNARLVEAGSLAHLARGRLLAGDVDAAAEAADAAVDLSHRQEIPVVGCSALLARAQLRRMTAAAGAAEDLAAATALVARTGARTYEPFIAEESARLDGDRDGLAAALSGYAAVGAYGHAARLAGELGR